MLDHMGFAVSDYEKSKAFYVKALKPLGIGIVMEVSAEDAGGHPAVGFGTGQKPFFWIAAEERSGRVHVAFTVPDRKTVDAFYKAALAAGAKDNGAPGIRAHYHPDYYGAFVLDRDGNNIEAVCHAKE